MKHLFKRYLAAALAAVLVWGAVNLGVDFSAAETSGVCGENLSWSLDSSGTLRITGSGNMDSWEYGLAPWSAFSGQIITVIIAPGVTSVASSAFLNCSSLSGLDFPSSVQTIGSYAFESCSALINIRIPADSVLSEIGQYAFLSSGIKRITLPASVTALGDCAFRKCLSLEEITVADANPNYSSDTAGVLFNKDKTTLIKYPSKSTAVSYAVPDSVSAISPLAFENCTSLQSITVAPENACFANRENDGVVYSKDLSNLIVYPAGKTDASFQIHNNVTQISSFAFSPCSFLENVTVPEFVTVINENTFLGCSSLKSVTFAENSRLTYISANAFNGCSALESIAVPASVTALAASAFEGCASLKSVAFAPESSLEIINDKVFLGCAALESIVIPAGVMSLGAESFSDCASLKSVTLEEGSVLAAVKEAALRGCAALESFAVPEKVTAVSPNTFYGCSALESITFADTISLETIGSGAFYGCSKLSGIAIPASVISIAADAFDQCPSLQSFGVDSANQNYSSDEYGVLFNKNKTELIRCPEHINQTTYRVPDSVTAIAADAFAGCTKLDFVFIPETVLIIGSDITADTSICITSDTESCYAKAYASKNGIPFRIRVESVWLSPTTVTVESGETVQISVSFTPENATLKSVIWTTNKASVATVSSTGLVTAKNPGTAAISVKALDGGQISYCVVTVTAPPTTATTEPTTQPPDLSTTAEPPTQPSTAEPSTQPSTTEPVVINAAVSLKAPSKTSCSHGDIIVIHANTENLPDGAAIEWSVNGTSFTLSDKNTPCTQGHTSCVTCRATAVASGESAVNAKITKDGKVIAESNQIKLNSNSGFFQKLISFFKNLFRISRIVAQEIKF